jgi:long-chain acyl-CoA synthetase
VNAVPYFYDRLRRLAEPTGGGRPDRLRELFGGRIRSCQCGGAAVSQATFDYYWQQGVPLFPGYGLTESSPVISVWGPDEATWDLVGRPIPGIEVRLAADGEILTRGPHVMAGYWRDADATREAIRGGWLHTGDLGVWDDGRLGVRGRKKELIVTTGGKKIVPSLLEMLLGQDPLILQAFVTGDGRDYPVALIVPDRDQLAKEADLANAACGSDNGLQVEAALRQLFQRRIEQRLAGLSRHEQIRRFALLPRPFSLEAGELTAKSSLRRDVILRNWAEEIEALYRQ